MDLTKLKILTDAIQQLSLARDMEAVITVVRTGARKLTGADGATFVLKDNGNCFYVDEDAIEPLWKGQKFPLEICISGWSMINKSVALIEDIYEDPRIPVDAYKPTFVKSLAMVPIRTQEPLGAIGIYWAKKHKPNEEEITLLQSLAEITSVSIENVQAFPEIKEQNQTLKNIAFQLASQVQKPMTQIQHLFKLFHFDDPTHPINREIIIRLKESAGDFDNIIKSLNQMTKNIKQEF